MTRAAIEFFQCTKLGVKLTRAACGQRHADAERKLTAAEAYGGAGRGLDSCRGCPIGEAHAAGDAHADAPAIVIPVEDLVGRGYRAKLQLVSPAAIEPAPEPKRFRCIECGRDGHTWEECPRLKGAKIDRAIERATQTSEAIVPAPAAKSAVRAEATTTVVEVKAPVHTSAPPARPAAERRAAAGALNAAFTSTPASSPVAAKAATREERMGIKKKCVICGREFEPKARADVARFCGDHSQADRAAYRREHGQGTPAKNGKSNGEAKPARSSSTSAPTKRSARSSSTAPAATNGAPASPRAALELLGYEVLSEVLVPKGRLLLVADEEG